MAERAAGRCEHRVVGTFTTLSTRAACVRFMRVRPECVTMGTVFVCSGEHMGVGTFSTLMTPSARAGMFASFRGTATRVTEWQSERRVGVSTELWAHLLHLVLKRRVSAL